MVNRRASAAILRKWSSCHCSSAAAGVCYNEGLCERAVKVHQPGGTLDILVKDGFEIELTGDVSSVGQGQFSAEFMDKLNLL